MGTSRDLELPLPLPTAFPLVTGFSIMNCCSGVLAREEDKGGFVNNNGPQLGPITVFPSKSKSTQVKSFVNISVKRKYNPVMFAPHSSLSCPRWCYTQNLSASLPLRTELPLRVTQIAQRIILWFHILDFVSQALLYSYYMFYTSFVGVPQKYVTRNDILHLFPFSNINGNLWVFYRIIVQIYCRSVGWMCVKNYKNVGKEILNTLYMQKRSKFVSCHSKQHEL